MINLYSLPFSVLPLRFWRKVRVLPNGCWEWIAFRNRQGYGRFLGSSQKAVSAHRWAYEHLIGPIPNGLTIDHLCRNRSCVNPAHMEAVTIRENTLRSPIAPAAVNARKRYCVRGHPFNAANTGRTPDGRRYCRLCNRLRQTQRGQSTNPVQSPSRCAGSSGTSSLWLGSRSPNRSPR